MHGFVDSFLRVSFSSAKIYTIHPRRITKSKKSKNKRVVYVGLRWKHFTAFLRWKIKRKNKTGKENAGACFYRTELHIYFCASSLIPFWSKTRTHFQWKIDCFRSLFLFDFELKKSKVKNYFERKTSLKPKTMHCIHEQRVMKTCVNVKHKFLLHKEFPFIPMYTCSHTICIVDVLG